MFSSKFTILLLGIGLLLTGCKTPKNSAKEPIVEIQLPEVKIVAKPIYKGTETKYFDLLHMHLSIKPDWKNRRVDGTEILTLTPHAHTQDTLELDAKDFDIHGIYLAKGENNLQELKFKYDKKKLRISLIDAKTWMINHNDTIFQNGVYQVIRERISLIGMTIADTFEISIKYTAKPEDQNKDSVKSKKEEQGFTFINPDGVDSGVPREFWSQGEADHNSAWFPTIEDPGQKITQQIDITVDTAMTTLSNGKLDKTTINRDGTKTDHWSMNLPHSVYLVMAAGGTYKIIKDHWRNIPVNYFVEPEYAPYAMKVFGRTPAMIEYFSKLLKYDYVWPKYDQMVVRDFTSGAMENTTAVLMYEEMQHDDRAHLDNSEEEVISHELFHHWFGDLVTCKNWANLCLNESFASASEALWEGHEHGEDAADLMRKTALDAYLNEAVFHKGSIIEHYYNQPDDLFDKHRYEKGALVLHMLRKYLGDTIYFKALHNYLVAHAWKTAELCDLREAMEQASGQDLNWFFEQWFEKPGHPIMEITQEYKGNEKKLYFYVKQTQHDDRVPLFKAKVYIEAIASSDSPKMTHGRIIGKYVWLSNAYDTFTVDCAAAPMSTFFDGKHELALCQKKEIKPWQQWYNQYLHYNDFQTRYEALQALADKNGLMTLQQSEKLWASALKDPFWYIRKQAIQIIQSLPDSVWQPLVPEIESMAQLDEKSAVRTAALAFFGDKEKRNSNVLSEKMLHDSSYSVVAMAIHNLFVNTPGEDSAALVKKLAFAESYTRSTDVMAALAGVYSKYGDASKARFFAALKGYGGQYFTYYLRFLARMDNPTIASQEPYILHMDKYLKSPWDLSSYQSFLYELSDKISKRANGGEKPTATKLADEMQAKARKLVIKF